MEKMSSLFLVFLISVSTECLLCVVSLCKQSLWCGHSRDRADLPDWQIDRLLAVKLLEGLVFMWLGLIFSFNI